MIKNKWTVKIILLVTVILAGLILCINSINGIPDAETNYKEIYSAMLNANQEDNLNWGNETGFEVDPDNLQSNGFEVPKVEGRAIYCTERGVTLAMNSNMYRGTNTAYSYYNWGPKIVSNIFDPANGMWSKTLTDDEIKAINNVKDFGLLATIRTRGYYKCSNNHTTISADKAYVITADPCNQWTPRKQIVMWMLQITGGINVDNAETIIAKLKLDGSKAEFVRSDIEAIKQLYNEAKAYRRFKNGVNKALSNGGSYATNLTDVDNITSEYYTSNSNEYIKVGPYTMKYVNGKYKDEKIIFGGIDGKEDKEKIQSQNQEFSMEGLRVLAFTFREIPEEHLLTAEDEDHLVFLGMIAMMDPPREESKAAVEECIKAGIRPVMITGDHKITAAAIAKRIGILKDLSEACEGAEIENMSDEELRGFVPKISVYARVSPEHKIRIVRAWQERGNIVSMTGDGVNDAPALKQADIGVAMGVTGTEVAKDAAAMVLTDDNFATIVKAVENGRNLYRNIKYAIQFLLSGNFGAILAVLYASIAGLPVPFAPVHLLFINLLTDSLPAIALGVEPHTSDVMNEKPRPADESILTKDFLSKIGLEGLVIGVMTMISFLTGYHQDGALLGSTYAFGTLCLARLFHGYNCKSDHPVIFTKRFFNNKWMQGAFALGAILITAVLTIPGLHQVFKVETLNFEQLGTVYLYAFACFPIIQLLKWVRGKLSE